MGETSPVSAIEAIEKAMEGVTPGPWQVHQTVIYGVTYGGHWVEVADEDQLIQISGSGGARSYTQRVFDTQGHDDNEDNARYVAACNPVAMREVLALARQAEALQRMLRELTNAGDDVLRGLDARIQAAPGNAVPVFYGIVDLSDALHRARALLGGSENAE